MAKSWEDDNCAAMKAHYAVYSIPQAAALWCGVPEENVAQILEDATQPKNTGLARCIWVHFDVPCLEPRCRALAEATEDGSLPHGREDGHPTGKDDHVAYERRHFYGRELKKWLEKTLPNEKPAFLFDDIERNVHSAISADSYRALQADRDALEKRIKKATQEFKKLRQKKDAITGERDSLKAIVDKMGPPGERSEATYHNMIAALLDCIAGNLPGIEKHPSFDSEAKLIDAIDEHYRGYGGLSKSNLSRKFPKAKRTLRSQ